MACTSVLLSIILCLWTACRQVTSEKPLQLIVQEERPAGTQVANILLESPHHDKYTGVDFNALSVKITSKTGPYKDSFTLHNKSGILKTKEKIDRDSLCQNELKCVVSFDITVRGKLYFQMVKVNVLILDINDNKPQFPNRKVSFSIMEERGPGVVGVIPLATDIDSGQNGVQGYNILAGSSAFKITEQSGSILLETTRLLDRETKSFHKLTIVAHDGGIPRKSGSVVVEVNVDDINDNRPVFDNKSYSVRVLENTPVNSNLLHVTAHDADVGVNGQVVYRFAEQSKKVHGDLFAINRDTGTIILKRPLTYQGQSSYGLTVIAIDKGPNAVPVAVPVTISIVDVNNHAPEIAVHDLTPAGEVQITENAGKDAFVAHITVSDKDGGENGKFNCSMIHSHFSLQNIYTTEYKIVTAINIDRESRAKFTVGMTCRDGGRPPKKSFQRIIITVLDTNDNAPIFTQNIYIAKIPENNKVGATIIRINATDRDSGENARITYGLKSKHAGLVDISQSTGHIFANVQFDREQRQDLEATVFAQDQGNPPRTSSATVHINVLDVNDEAPRFSQGKYGFHVLEGEPAGTEVGKVYATDADAAPHNKIRYTITSQASSQTFTVDGDSGIIRTTDVLFKDNTSVYQITVLASDIAAPKLNNSTNVSIYVVTKAPVAVEVVEEESTLLGLTGYNWVIILSLSGALIATVIILVIVIVCYTRRRRRIPDRRGYISGNLVRDSNRDGEAFHKGEYLDGVDRIQHAWGTLLDVNQIPYFHADIGNEYVRIDPGSEQTLVLDRSSDKKTPEKLDGTFGRNLRLIPDGGPNVMRQDKGHGGHAGQTGSTRKSEETLSKTHGMRNSRSAQRGLEMTLRKSLAGDDSDSACSADVSNSDSANAASEDVKRHRHHRGKQDGSTFQFTEDRYGNVDSELERVGHKKQDSFSSFDSEIMGCRSGRTGSRGPCDHHGLSESSGASPGHHRVALVHPQRSKRGTERMSLTDSCRGQYGSSFDEERIYVGEHGQRDSELEGDSDTGSSDNNDTLNGNDDKDDDSVLEGRHRHVGHGQAHGPKPPGRQDSDDCTDCLNDTDFYESETESRTYNIMV